MPAELSLRGNGVWLRPIEPRDAMLLSRASHHEREIAMTGARIPLSSFSFEAWISGLDTREHVFAICRAGDDTCIGTTSLRNIDMHHGTAETGIGLLASDDRGRGLGREAKRLLLDYAFRILGLHVVSCTIASYNARSIRAVERQGYRYAGRLTAALPGPGGTFCDQLVYDLTRDEWMSRSGHD